MGRWLVFTDPNAGTAYVEDPPPVDRARVYRSSLWRVASPRPFCFWSLSYPSHAFATEAELLKLAAREPRTLEPGHANRFAYPLDFCGPLPDLVAR